MRQKSAGLRTHSLVGLGAALFVLVSTYGFSDVLDQDHVVLDPSRVAAQIVSGIGFIGGGLIFVRRDSVRGLTTAAGVWVTAAVGTAAGAGLGILATATTAAYLLVAYVADLSVHHLGDRDDAVAVELSCADPVPRALAADLDGLEGILAVGARTSPGRRLGWGWGRGRRHQGPRNRPYKVTGPLPSSTPRAIASTCPRGRSRCAAAGSRRPSRSATPPIARRASTRASVQVRSVSRA